MIYPTIETLGGGVYDRYPITVAVAKAARLVNEQYSKEKEEAERLIGSKGSDKCINALISEEIRDEKAVKVAIDRLNSGYYRIVEPETKDEK